MDRNISSNGFTFADNLTLWAGNANATATLSGAIGNAGAGLLSGSLTVKAAGDITSTAAITTQTQNVTLNSDTDQATLPGGGIMLNTGSSISSLGGAIVLGGGVNPLTGYAIGTAGSLNSGIHVLGNITAGAGSVTMHGQSALGDGITFAGGTLASDGITTINGTTSMAGGGSAATTIAGVNFRNAGTRLTTAAGTVTITGITSSNNWSQGVTVDAATIETTGSGSLTLNGTDTFPGAGAASWGVGLNTGGLVRSTGAAGGSLNFNSNSGDWGSVLMSGSITSNGGAVNMTDQSTNGIFLLGAGGINAGTNGSISLTADKTSISNPLQATGGTLSIKPFTAGTTIGIAGGVGTLALTAANFASNFMTGFSGITVGDATSGAITVGGAVSANDSLALISSSSIAINAALSDAVNKTLTLTGGTMVSGTGNITATSLLLNGAGTYNLNTAAANSVGTLAATGVAGLSFTNSGVLTIGAVGANIGISTTGAINLSSSAGSIAVNDIINSGGVTLSAATGITQAANITATGNIALTANANGGVGNNFVQRQGSIANAATGNITINAYDIQVGSTSSVNAVQLNASHDIKILNSGLFGGGTAQNFKVDDASFAYTLPFGFSFYGVPYATMYVSSNGVITFGAGTTAFSSSAAGLIAGVQNVPTISPAWCDWITTAIANNDIYIHQASATSLVVRWDVASISNRNNTANFETVLSQQGNISFNYGAAPVTTPSYSAIVGLSKADGVHYTLSSHNASASLNNLATASFNYDVTTGNYLETLAGNGGNSINATAGVSMLATGATTISNAVSAASVNVQSGNGITLGSTVTLTASTAGNAIVMDAGAGNFINSAGASALNNTGGGRWLVYSSSTALDSFGGLASGNLALWGVNAATYAPANVIETGNRYLFSQVPVLSVSASLSKVYGADLSLTPQPATITGLINAAAYGNVFSQDVITGAASFTSAGFVQTAGVAASPYVVSVTPGTLAAPAGYGVISYVNGSLTVSPFALMVSAVGIDKVYDATTAATVSLLDNRFAWDAGNLGMNYGASFADQNAGTGKVVSVSAITATGSAAGNYSFNTTTVTTAGITPAALSINAVTDAKIYDGGVSSAGVVTFTGLVGGDTVTGAVQTFGSKNVQGANLSILNAAGYTVNDGNLGGNYTVTANTAAGTITAKALIITAAGVNKLYDGLTTATETLTDNRIAGDVLTTGLGVASFLDKNAAIGKIVNVSGITLTGVDAGNYTFNSTAATTANITPATLIIAANAAAKVFDGIAYAGGAGVTYTGFMNGETSAVLLGALSYGGTSQGANFSGSYLITPGGLTGNNYSVGYVNGALMISAPPVMPTVLPPPAFQPPVVTTVTAPLSNPLVILPASTPATQPASVPATAAQPAATSGTQPATGTQPVSVPATPTTPAGAIPAANQNGSGGVGSGGGLPVASKPVAQPAVGSTSAKQNAAVAISGEPAITPDAVTTAVASVPVTPKALSTILAASDSPAKGLESLAGNRVQSAVAKGMSPEQAERTGNAYSAALVKQINQGVPMNEAIAQAEQVFTATESFPPPKSIQEVAVKNLAAGGNDVARQLTSLANAETSSGSAAFDQALSSSLAKGMSFTDAVKVAQDAVQVADAMARADSSPQSMLANSSAIGRLGNTSATFQKTLSSLMTRGYTLEEAMQRATQLAGNEAASAAADARSPSYALASGNFKALEGHATDGNFGKALSSALARGVPIDEAVVMVTKLEAQELRAIAADARSPVAGFSSGRIVTEKSNATFDRALSNAISRGEKPDQALVSAQRASASETRVKPTIATALASGHKVESLLIGENTSRTYRMVLGNSLARGLPAAQAIALARRAENANAFHYPLTSALARKMNGGAGSITMAGGKPLPGWLQFNPKSGEFVAFEVPPGALPMPVVIRVGKQEYKIDISEGGLRGNNKQFRTKPQI